MHGYEEDLDEEAGYDDYYSDDNGLDEYEDDEEEEEQEVPPKEELEYLELRQKIKESIRKKLGKGSVNAQSSQDRRKKLPYNDFGSFFGPSRPVISSRVIQESKSLLENEIKHSNQPQKKRPAPTNGSGNKNVSQEKRPKPVSAVRKKVETLKDTRDYSFLFSDDAELPVPKREQPLSRSGSFPNSQSRSAQLSARPKQQQSSGINNGRASAHAPPREEKRPVVSARPSSSGSQMNHSRPSSSGSQMHNSRPTGSQMQSRPVSGRPASSGSSQMQQRAAPSGSQRPGSSTNRQAPTRPPPGSSMNGPSANRNGQPSSRPDPQRSAPAKMPMDHRRQMSSSGHGVGPARSVSTSKPLPSKSSSSSERRPSMSAGKSSLQSAQRPSSRPMSSDPRQRLAEQQRKVPRDPTTSRMIPKQSAPTSKHQQMMSKPAAKRPPLQREIDDRRPLKKKKPMSEDDKALSMIRQMFNTDRYAGRDYDDRDMEAGFDDIMKEERRSARIAREEDEIEAKLIAQEEELERQRKLRKLRR